MAQRKVLLFQVNVWPSCDQLIQWTAGSLAAWKATWRRRAVAAFNQALVSD